MTGRTCRRQPRWPLSLRDDHTHRGAESRAASAASGREAGVRARGADPAVPRPRRCRRARPRAWDGNPRQALRPPTRWPHRCRCRDDRRVDDSRGRRRPHRSRKAARARSGRAENLQEGFFAVVCGSRVGCPAPHGVGIPVRVPPSKGVRRGSRKRSPGKGAVRAGSNVLAATGVARGRIHACGRSDHVRRHVGRARAVERAHGEGTRHLDARPHRRRAFLRATEVRSQGS